METANVGLKVLPCRYMTVYDRELWQCQQVIDIQVEVALMVRKC